MALIIISSKNLIHLNGITADAPNLCSYPDLAVFNLDKNVLQAKRKNLSRNEIIWLIL